MGLENLNKLYNDRKIDLNPTNGLFLCPPPVVYSVEMFCYFCLINTKKKSCVQCTLQCYLKQGYRKVC